MNPLSALKSATPEPDAPEPQLSRSTRTMVLVVASMGGFLVTFMSSAINIALPLIGDEFGTSAVMLSWVSMAYVLVSGATLLPLGRVADLHGRVRVFAWGMVLFSLMSFASAFAPSIWVLLLFRAIHGIGLAIGAATSTALVVLAYPPESRGKAMGISVTGVYTGVTLGPVLGGSIVHNLGWRALFLVVGALSVVNAILPFWKLRGIDWKEPQTGRFDVLGSILYAAALTALLLGFSLLPDIPGAVLLAAGIVGVGLFLWWEARAEDPLLNVDLIRQNRVFGFSNIAAFIQYSATSAMIFLMSLYLQYSRGLNAQTAGLVLMSGAFLQAAVSPIVGRLTDRVESRYLSATGMVVCVLGLLGLSFLGAATPYWYIILMVCVVGVGVALFATPNTHAIMGSVETRWVGIASATVAMMRQAGMSMSQGVATLVLAVEVGRQAIQPSDYPQVLTSARITFLIFTVFCLIGIGTALIGRRQPAGSG